jgi:hypothetical protein
LWFYTFNKQKHQVAKNNKSKSKSGASVHIIAAPKKGSFAKIYHHWPEILN